MKYAWCLIPILLISCASTISPSRLNRVHDIPRALDDVVVSDGINETEAKLIGKSYYLLYALTGTGGVGAARKEGDSWLLSVLADSDGNKMDDIRIDSRSGSVSWPRGPYVADPREMKLLASSVPRR